MRNLGGVIHPIVESPKALSRREIRRVWVADILFVSVVHTGTKVDGPKRRSCATNPAIQLYPPGSLPMAVCLTFEQRLVTRLPVNFPVEVE